ncbi:BTAD domain-containing putative transcriptional regulator [Roseibium sp.]|uniref:BTAD domain-containing putative transcriptional regulator n=1 Tax=Roseibium sp. TaxID=1936156 RepID=UPI003A9813D6
MSRLYLNILGTPELLDDAGAPAAVSTRKSLALLAYLMRTPERRAPREQIADILWSNAPREKAIQSLRQAVRQLRKIEIATGVTFLEAGKIDLGICDQGLVSDIEQVSAFVASGGAAGLEAATALLRGPFLNGYDSLDTVFSDWLIVERQRITSDLTSKALKAVDGLAAADDTAGVEAGCGVLLSLDGTCEYAHRLLIKTYLATGRQVEAQQQMKRCEAELRAFLDAEPDVETLQLFEQTKGLTTKSSNTFVLEPISDIAAVSLHQGSNENAIRLPQLTIMSFGNSDGLEPRALSILDDVRTCLGAYRNIQLYESSFAGLSDGTATTMLDAGDELGSYLLRFRYDDMMASVYLQLENRTSGQVLFNEVIDLNDISGSRQLRETASQTVNRIQSRILGRLRGQAGASLPFSKWCQAEALLCEFSRDADKKAFRILEDVQKAFPTYSVTYAGMASVGLKELLHYPDFNNGPPDPRGILDLAEQSVMLDPWHVFCRRMHGWSLLQCGHQVDAQNTFAEAARLNPFDPVNLMSVAEGLAYLGDVGEAERYADRAFKLLPVVPRFFYEYLANIQFSAGAYDTALDMLNRAPRDGILSITTKVAALMCAGREGEARAALEAMSARHSDWVARAATDYPEEIAGWLNRANLYQDPVTRQNYRTGVEMVRSFLLN